jgi:autoinducer 2-degrading protein
MRRILFTLALLVPTWLGGQPGPAAPPAKGYCVVTHVDIGGGPLVAQATALLREYAADSRKEPGSVRFEILQQEGHPNHFTVFEVWQTRKAYEGHAAAEHTKRFREKLLPMLGSPLDERLESLLP